MQSEALPAAADVSPMSWCCRICGSPVVGARVCAEERAYGTHEEFDYVRCGQCGCLQIARIPDDLGRHYPSDYYSFIRQAPSIKSKVRDFLAIFGPAVLFAGHQWWEIGDKKAVRDSGARTTDRILDLGCGDGALISSLYQIGFTKASGADPFISDDVIHANGARVMKAQASEIQGQFDLVMMHHSLEHVADQAGLAQDLRRLVAATGRLVIRIPTVESWAAEMYGRDWAHFEAPRHLYLHSRTSIRLLLERAGFVVTKIVDDAGSYSLTASEHLKRGGRLGDHRPSREESAAAWRRARALNREGRGDAIAVHARVGGPASGLG